MQKLTNTQRDYLRREAHSLKPVVQIGKQGLTESVQASTEQALSARELIKIKFLDFRDQKQELAEDLAGAVGGMLISVIGNIAILYREQPDPAKRKLVLPG
jgi:RNA-binding protein